MNMPGAVFVSRPTLYSDELAGEICRRMAEGESVNTICKDDDMPARSTVMLWVATDREGFSDKYAKACEARAHYWAEELLDIVDNEVAQPLLVDGVPMESNGEIVMVKDSVSVNHARLRADTRKWLLSKLLPKYADKPEPQDPDDLANALSKLADKLPE